MSKLSKKPQFNLFTILLIVKTYKIKDKTQHTWNLKVNRTPFDSSQEGSFITTCYWAVIKTIVRPSAYKNATNFLFTSPLNVNTLGTISEKRASFLISEKSKNIFSYVIQQIILSLPAYRSCLCLSELI